MQLHLPPHNFYNANLCNMSLQRTLLVLPSSSSVGQVHPPTLANHPAVYFEIVCSPRLWYQLYLKPPVTLTKHTVSTGIVDSIEQSISVTHSAVIHFSYGVLALDGVKFKKKTFIYLTTNLWTKTFGH